jgi:hypothetical protein
MQSEMSEQQRAHMVASDRGQKQQPTRIQSVRASVLGFLVWIFADREYDCLDILVCRDSAKGLCEVGNETLAEAIEGRWTIQANGAHRISMCHLDDDWRRLSAHLTDVNDETRTEESEMNS